MMRKKYYLTTPLYYVNASPHIGHSYTTIAADCMARYKRARMGKDNVHFLTGTDEHGQKIQKAADEAGLSPQLFADKVSAQFRQLWRKLDVSYDDFIRTTEERHVKTVQRALEILYAKGEIYESQYQGWYCTPCETFWVESQLRDSLCPDCKRPVEKITENNYFLRMKKHQKWLVEHIEANPLFIRPESRRNETLSFLRSNELGDLCISRPKERLAWGIPLPFSPGHVTYVWFDALLNYISAVGEFDASGNYVSSWWPADVHFMAKDILRQHAVYWPVILHALGIEPPRCVFAHGWWLMQDAKMSKSRGNVVSPVEVSERFGIDAYKYFLLRDVPFGLDGNFSQESIVQRFNGDLANDLGNLVHRTATMLEKYCSGRIPADFSLAPGAGKEIMSKAVSLKEDTAAAMEVFDFSAVLERIWAVIGMANKYVEETKPWNLSKEGKKAEIEAFLAVLAGVLRSCAFELVPFMPRTAETVLAQFSCDEVKKGQPLFPRIEK
jgi:methionyl-tRNA synthetase